MSNNNIYQVISRHFVNTQSEKDETDLKVWINESDENKSLYEQMDNHWHSPIQYKTTVLKHDEVKSDLLDRLNFKMPKSKKSGRLSMFLMYAAVAALLLCSVFVFYTQIDEGPSIRIGEQLITKSNTVGRKSEIHLKDGTIVNLNSDSKLSYEEAFSDSSRIVRLEGEAFFDVAKDPLRPFYVISENVVVKALGTSFNISAYSELDELRISLKTGKIGLSDNADPFINGAKGQIVLLPGQEVFYKKGLKSFSLVTEYNSDVVYGWKDGLLYFEKNGLEEIVQKLERWYGVDIDVISKPIKKLNYTGKFKRQNLENVLISMGFVNDFDFEINNKNVMLNFKNDAYE